MVLEEGESLHTYSRFCRLRSNPWEIEARLCIPRKGFVLNVEAKLHDESTMIQRCFDDNNDDNKR